MERMILSRHAARAALMSRWTPGLACPHCAAAEGDVDHLTAQPPHHTPPHPASLTPPHTIHALTTPGSSRLRA
jgi:hypothetical protein